MALADYSTAVEKIAALRCALIDPALVNYHAHGTTFSVSEPIYLLTRAAGIWGLKTGALFVPSNEFGYGALVMDSFGFPARMNAGKTLDIQFSGWSLAYIKDSDIVYSDPVIKYQDRLAVLYESETIISGNFTVGEYGALLTYSDVDGSGSMSINGSKIYDDNVAIAFPAKKNDVVTYSIENGSHIDLPAGW